MGILLYFYCKRSSHCEQSQCLTKSKRSSIPLNFACSERVLVTIPEPFPPQSLTATENLLNQINIPPAASTSTSESPPFSKSPSMQLNLQPLANKAAIVSGDRYRFTLLADGLLRYEWATDGIFEDRASTFVIRRNLPVPKFEVVDKISSLDIITERFHLAYDKKPFSPNGLTLKARGNLSHYHSLWRYGDRTYGLGGTARTLDEVDGRCDIGPGVIARTGITVIDDSSSMLLQEDGWVDTRQSGHRVDGYVFAYGHDYRAAIRALYSISGDQPLLPRWALGNWWSRFHPYSADEYLRLMDRFDQEGVPLSVAVLDMDWHIVDGEGMMGSGWTGYSWNKKLFPDPPAFLDGLHQRGLKTTLNVHPAEGVRSFEDAYEDVMKALNRDTSKGDPLDFDVNNPAFLDVYFNVLHRQLERQGVDFWWMDWQQGELSRVRGIDPLWMLNHYHFLDNASCRRRPVILSRYAGPGSHRYPLGFSGDSVASWASLDFQAEFTATASNIGYGWWSHDVGGHMLGCKDDELAARWVQLAVYFPILRLHSSSNPFNTKEPWKFGVEARQIMIDHLRMRHRLVPYLHTMNCRAAQGEPLIQPIYWDYPSRDEAYRFRNTFNFGFELMVAPITAPRDPKTRLGRVRTWVPPGRHVDIFNGVVYDGNREVWLHRPLDKIPVLARQGAIVPLDAATEPCNGALNPDSLEIIVVIGADGKFEMLEDDGTGSELVDVKWTRTMITYEQETGVVRIVPCASTSSEPGRERRRWTLQFPALAFSRQAHLLVDGREQPIAAVNCALGFTRIELGNIKVGSEIVVNIGSRPQLAITDTKRHIFGALDTFQIAFSDKSDIWSIVTSGAPRSVRVSQLHALDLDSVVFGAVLEYMLADSREEGAE